MKILLLGEYSNVHYTLALGLRSLGHDVTLASDGDNWKNYPRDIDMRRKSLSPLSSISYLWKTWNQIQSFKGYDIVQLINPVFIPLKGERIWPFYQKLRKTNGKIVMGAFGMDYYYVKCCLDFKTFEYSDFNFGNQERFSDENECFKRDWLFGSKGILNQKIATDCDAIVAGLYEYYVSYLHNFDNTDKLHFIPFPIKVDPLSVQSVNHSWTEGEPVKIFAGIQKMRSAYKGTDIMLKAAQRVAADYPEQCKLKISESLPFNQYIKLMNDSDIILDQLYSYTPAMNALEAMGRGLIAVTGGEPANYQVLQETQLQPIINVKPNEQSVYDALANVVINRNSLIPRLKQESIQYIAKHHDFIKVAKQYEHLYRSL